MQSARETSELIAATKPKVYDLYHSLFKGPNPAGTNQLAEWWESIPSNLAPESEALNTHPHGGLSGGLSLVLLDNVSNGD